MAQQITILSPLDLKPGAKAPDGRVVKTATLYATDKLIVVDVEFAEGKSAAYSWPSGEGWTAA